MRKSEGKEGGEGGGMTKRGRSETKSGEKGEAGVGRGIAREKEWGD